MRVISDTSPISNLAIIGRLEFLRDLHGTIFIPPAVQAELFRLRHSEARAHIDTAFSAGWLQTERIVKPPPENLNLHIGETESIALALQVPGSMLLIDETEGRRVARDLGLPVAGVIGILLAARRKEWIPALKPELLALRHRARFFLSRQIFVSALAAVGESP